MVTRSRQNADVMADSTPTQLPLSVPLTLLSDSRPSVHDDTDVSDVGGCGTRFWVLPAVPSTCDSSLHPAADEPGMSGNGAVRSRNAGTDGIRRKPAVGG